MFASAPSATLLGIDGHPVGVEVWIGGLPGFTVVGQPDAACREARDRVRAAVQASGLAWPNERVTVNLAPSGLRKIGAGLDLPIAIATLQAQGTLDPDALAGFGFLGELGLDGSLRPVPGTVSLVDAVACDKIVVPSASAVEASLVSSAQIYPADHLATVVGALSGQRPWPEVPPAVGETGETAGADLADVIGQPLAKQAIEVAAAGGHHILLIGPPGSGKTMLARRLNGVLPRLHEGDSLETTRIHSAAGVPLPSGGLVRTPPLRSPHHGVSTVAMVGGGSVSLKPGEISLAHGGVLFLDELGEFAPVTLDSLRQPLEEGVVRVSRSGTSAEFPARFILVGAMNPCPCGDSRPGTCVCAPSALARYARRISGPLLDRFDLRVEVRRPPVEALLNDEVGRSSSSVASRVAQARVRAQARGVDRNADIDDLATWAPLGPSAKSLLAGALEAGRLSARGLSRLRLVARTLADLDGCDDGPLSQEHVATALALRCRPRSLDMRAIG